MTNDNAEAWGPPSCDQARTPVQPLTTPTPAAGETSSWAPPLTQSAPGASRRAADGTDALDEAPVVPESIELDPVAAEVRKIGKVASRVLAAGMAVLMVGGGAMLAFGAGTADGGAASPEEAFEVLSRAVEAGDVLAIAEILEPTERDTLFDAGVDIAAELSRLDIFSVDLDLSSVSGVHIELAGFEPRIERSRSGLAHIYVGKGVATASVAGSDLPLGSLLTERLFEDPSSYSYTSTELIEAQSNPIVAVERNGRWYLSVWYTVAENVRIALDKPLPDLGRRPASIGGLTPEGAVESFLEDALRLDIRRMIGGLDPVEMAALYEYSPLWLESATASANEMLQSLEDDGWRWGFDELVFTSETDGDVARVQLASAFFSASGDRGALTVWIDADAVEVDVRTVDPYFGDETTTHFEYRDDCFSVSFDDGFGPNVEEYCGETADPAPFVMGGISSLGSLGLTEGLTLVTHRVDDQWYISPVRTGTDAIIRSLKVIDPGQLSEFLDSLPYVAGGFGDADRGFSTVQVPDPRIGPAIPIEANNLAMLASSLDPLFAYDLDADNYVYEVDYFAPALGSDLAVVAGLYASVNSPSGEVAVVVLELAGAIDAADLFVPLVVANSEAVGSHDGQRLWFENAAGQSVIVHVDGSTLVIVGGYGASAPDVAAAADTQVG